MGWGDFFDGKYDSSLFVAVGIHPSLSGKTSNLEP
jgi:hypothetical protein